MRQPLRIPVVLDEVRDAARVIRLILRRDVAVYAEPNSTSPETPFVGIAAVSHRWPLAMQTWVPASTVAYVLRYEIYA